jgi:hypothetical protein
LLLHTNFKEIIPIEILRFDTAPNVTNVRAYSSVIDLSGANEQILRSTSEDDLKLWNYTVIQILKGDVKVLMQYFLSANNVFFLKAWESVKNVLHIFTQLIVVLENLEPATNYSVRAVIFENDGQNTSYDLKETLFKTLPCVPRGM